jgi:MFS family permease
MYVLAYAFLTTYQAYYLLDKIGSAEADVPQQIFLGTLAQAAVIVAASLIGGKLSDRTGRRTWPSWWTWWTTSTARPRISVCSTLLAPFPSPSRRRSRRPSCPCGASDEHPHQRNGRTLGGPGRFAAG